MSQFHDLEVIEVKPLTPESVSVTLRIPAALQELYDFMPGQFVMVEKEINGQKLRRYYSIYNIPGEGVIKLGIKFKGRDGFADYAVHTLLNGDVLQVSPPMDDVPFVFDDEPRKFLGITIGSGITPFFSYIQYMVKYLPRYNFVLIYGNENSDKTMFYKELKEIERLYPGLLKIYHVFSKNDTGDYKGQINSEIIRDILQKEGTGFDGVYMVGPDNLKKTAATVLTANDIDPRKLYYRVYS